jgi:hypothetical protein
VPILELLASEDEPLLIRGRCLLDVALESLTLSIVLEDSTWNGDGLASKGLNEYMHLQKITKQQGKYLAVDQPNHLMQTATSCHVLCVHAILPSIKTINKSMHECMIIRYRNSEHQQPVIIHVYQDK